MSLRLPAGFKDDGAAVAHPLDALPLPMNGK